MNVAVSSVETIADEIKQFGLRRTDGGSLPAAEPGAHIDLHLPNGLVRQYSLIKPNRDPFEYFVAVKLDPASRGGSAELHRNVKVGTSLAIGGPRNHFPLEHRSEKSILIAGGIGITPIYAMAQRLDELKADWELHFASRNRAGAAFLSELAAYDRRVHLWFDEEKSNALMDLRSVVDRTGEKGHLYCCGPAPMLAAFEKAAAGRSPHTIHIEHFSNVVAPAAKGGFAVELQRSGIEIAVLAGETILEALERNGRTVPSSCREGLCGTCETRVISGKPDHRDVVMTAEEHTENGTMMICCSGSLGPRLVLDL